MSKRINIILPDQTMKVLDQVATKGNRSHLVSEAVLYFVRTRGNQSLRERLKTGYQAQSDESLKVAAAWFPIEEEAWHKSNGANKRSAR